jgi:hypothetical protein
MNQYYYYDIISLLLIKMIFQPVITIPSPESPWGYPRWFESLKSRRHPEIRWEVSQWSFKVGRQDSQEAPLETIIIHIYIYIVCIVETYICIFSCHMCNKDSKKDCVSYFVDSSCITEEINGKTITTQDISLSRNSVPQRPNGWSFSQQICQQNEGPDSRVWTNPYA